MFPLHSHSLDSFESYSGNPSPFTGCVNFHLILSLSFSLFSSAHLSGYQCPTSLITTVLNQDINHYECVGVHTNVTRVHLKSHLGVCTHTLKEGEGRKKGHFMSSPLLVATLGQQTQM